jgi:predicted RNA binding protein YcfA (HicA-like mRNA interferase family)
LVPDKHQTNLNLGRQVIVAMHGSKPIPVGTLKSIIEGSGLDVEDFR